jgi:hypothetical protein
VQIRVGRRFSADDAFLLFGLSTLTSAIAVINAKAIDSAYLVTALLEGNPNLVLTANVIQEAYDYQVSCFHTSVHSL